MMRLDHLVVAAASLAEGRDWVEARLGVPSPGGMRRWARTTLSGGSARAIWR